jgi:outer membrane lipoprotein-sorting protein
VVLCAVLAVVVLAGCTGLLGSEPDLPSGDEVADQRSETGVYNATVIYKTELGNETVENRIERTVRPATGERYEVTTRNGNQTITVSNGTATWFYQPGADEVTLTSLDENRTAANETEQLRKLFDSVESEDANGAQVTPVFPLFPAPSGSEDASATQTDLWTEPIEGSYEGVETVAGRDAHVLRMESAEDADRQMQQTMYFDAEYYVLLRGEWNMEVGREDSYDNVTGSMRVEEIDFDPDIDEDIFEFDPPENATVDRLGQNIDTFENYDDVVSESEMPVPEPDAPSGFEFDTGTVTTNAVSLVYENETATLFISRRTTGGIRDEAKEIRRDGRTYYYDDQYGSSTVQWECGDAIYSVGGQLGQEQVLRVAESVQCVPPEE